MDWIKSQARKAFSKKNLYKKVPVLEWLPKYNVETGLFTFFAVVVNKQLIFAQQKARNFKNAQGKKTPEIKAIKQSTDNTDLPNLESFENEIFFI